MEALADEMNNVRFLFKIECQRPACILLFHLAPVSDLTDVVGWEIEDFSDIIRGQHNCGVGFCESEQEEAVMQNMSCDEGNRFDDFRPWIYRGYEWTRFLALRFVFFQTGPINQGVLDRIKAPMEKTDHRFGAELEAI
jgi:hypothetical protein